MFWLLYFNNGGKKSKTLWSKICFYLKIVTFQTKAIMERNVEISKQFCFHQLSIIVKKISDLASLNLANNHSKNWICIRGIILDFIPNVSIHFLKKCPKNGILGNQGKTIVCKILILWNKSSKWRFYAYLLWL